MSWLPTMATRWEKQLSLSKEKNSDQDIKEKFDFERTAKKIVLHHHLLSFPAKFQKMQTNDSLKDQQVMIL
jgi:hypothetical protein